MISAKDVCFSYDKKRVLRGINFQLKSGELVSLLGVNGSGKTTLLKLICGLLQPDSGKLCIGDIPIKEMSGQELSRAIAYMPQKSNGVFCSVFDAVLIGRRPHIGFEVSRHDIEIATETIKMLGLTELAFSNTSELSGGELQKVIIARALVQEPKVLLLDEPINHLDIRNQLEIMTIIKNITKRLNLTTVIVLHDLNMAMRFSDKFLLLKEGKVYAFGGKEVITPQIVKEVYQIDVVIQNYGGYPLIIPC
ncbi:MAG: ABC transporter ATP-binding protein [Desulfatiglandales bacterium]